jgi:hypothetical protein
VASKRDEAPRRHHQKEDCSPVVGMGDHVPMFLLRPATVKPLKPAAGKTEPGKNTRLG